MKITTYHKILRIEKGIVFFAGGYSIPLENFSEKPKVSQRYELITDEFGKILSLNLWTYMQDEDSCYLGDEER